MAETKEEYRFKNKQNWQEALNKAPQDKWIGERDVGRKKPAKFVPIGVLQALGDVFFDEFDVIDNHIQVIVNEVCCTVKIQVLPSYPNSEYRIISGSASKPIQSRKGSFPDKFPKGKITNSLEYCLPAARSMAIANALNTIGNVFGRNVGRELISDGYNMSKTKKK